MPPEQPKPHRERATEEELHQQFAASEEATSKDYTFKPREVRNEPLGFLLHQLEEVSAPRAVIESEERNTIRIFRKKFDIELGKISNEERRGVIKHKLDVIWQKIVFSNREILDHAKRCGIDPGQLNPISDAKKLDDKAILDISRQYAAQYFKEQQELQGKIGPAIEKTLEALAIIFPGITVSLPTIKKRLRNIKFFLADELDQILRADEEWMGSYMGEDQTIHISNAVEPKYQDKVITHELVHAVSGHAYTKIKVGEELLPPDLEVMAEEMEVQYGGQEEVDVQNQRVGIHFDHTRFRWLNEAITEHITQIVMYFRSRKPGSSAFKVEEFKLALALFGPALDSYSGYRNETALLEKLIEKIPVKIFYRAFFENFDSEAHKTGTSAVPRWHELRAAINAAYSSTFLVQLDRYVEKFGPQRAREVMDEDGWKEIDQYK